MDKTVNMEYLGGAYGGKERASAANSIKFGNYGQHNADLYALNDFFFNCLFRSCRIIGDNFYSGWDASAMLGDAYGARPNGDLWVSVRICKSETVFICDREFVFGRLVGFEDKDGNFIDFADRNGRCKIVVEHPCGDFKKLNDGGYMKMAEQLHADFANYERSDEMTMSSSPIPGIWPGAVSRNSMRFDSKHVWRNDNGSWGYGFPSRPLIGKINPLWLLIKKLTHRPIR